MTMAERIIYLRTRKGLRQAELARLAHMAPPTLHGYESGYRQAEHMPLDIACALARALGVSVDYLAGLYEEHQDSVV